MRHRLRSPCVAKTLHPASPVADAELEFLAEALAELRRFHGIVGA